MATQGACDTAQRFTAASDARRQRRKAPATRYRTAGRGAQRPATQGRRRAAAGREAAESRKERAAYRPLWLTCPTGRPAAAAGP
jgi:hypothetical protein